MLLLLLFFKFYFTFYFYFFYFLIYPFENCSPFAILFSYFFRFYCNWQIDKNRIIVNYYCIVNFLTVPYLSTVEPSSLRPLFKGRRKFFFSFILLLLYFVPYSHTYTLWVQNMRNRGKGDN